MLALLTGGRPDDIGPLRKSFYKGTKGAAASIDMTVATATDAMDKRWSAWLGKWQALINGAGTNDANAVPLRSHEAISTQMKRVNPKYSWREWFVVPAYSQAAVGNYAVLRELQEVLTQPYAEQSKGVEAKYYRLKPPEFFAVGGLSHYSCSS